MVDACSTVSTGSRGMQFKSIPLCRLRQQAASMLRPSGCRWILSLLYITEKYSHEVVGPVRYRYSAPPIPVSRRVGTRHSAAGGGRGE